MTDENKGDSYHIIEMNIAKNMGMFLYDVFDVDKDDHTNIILGAIMTYFHHQTCDRDGACNEEIELNELIKLSAEIKMAIESFQEAL